MEILRNFRENELLRRALAFIACVGIALPTSACEQEPYECGPAVSERTFSEMLDLQFPFIPGNQKPETSHAVSTSLLNPQISSGDYLQACGTAKTIAVAIGPKLDEEGNVIAETTYHDIDISPYLQ